MYELDCFYLVIEDAFNVKVISADLVLLLSIVCISIRPGSIRLTMDDDKSVSIQPSMLSMVFRSASSAHCAQTPWMKARIQAAPETSESRKDGPPRADAGDAGAESPPSEQPVQTYPILRNPNVKAWCCNRAGDR